MRALAINVAANTSLPGVRGPVWPDGDFEYVPIPEREPTDRPVPTYADLDLSVSLPPELLDRRVHLDPCFREYADCPAYTYGDEHGVKAGPIAELSAGDHLLFYATLEPARAGRDPPSMGGPEPLAPDDRSGAAGHDDRSGGSGVDGAGTDRDGAGDAGESAGDRDGETRPWWAAPEWGAYLIGDFRLAEDPVTGDRYRAMDPGDRRRFASNAHCKRTEFDARVLVRGDDDSRLLDRAVPLSSRTAGSDPNRLVALSEDSGRGPWWRRPLAFDSAATTELLDVVDDWRLDACFVSDSDSDSGAGSGADGD